MTVMLDIIIVNWNAGRQLRDCLEAIVSAGRDGFSLGHVVVVDNASSDGSLDGLDLLSLPLNIIRNSVNRGFGAACNQGAAVCGAHYLLFLNPDTKLFENSLAVPLAFMEDEANQDVGICGIQLIDEDGVVSRSCYRFPTTGRLVAQAIGLDKLLGLTHLGLHMQEWDHQVSREVEQVIGAFFLVRHGLFASLGGFDERFFLYFEEVDFSFRARKAGWKSFYLTEAKTFHEGGGTTSQIKATRLFYSLRSRLLYCFKHLSLSKAWVLAGVTLLVEPISRVTLCLVRGDGRGVVDILQGGWRLWGEIWEIYRFARESKGAMGK